MKHLLLILICLAVIIDTYGQSWQGKVIIEITKLNRSSIFTEVQVLESPMGDSARLASLERQIKANMVIDEAAKKGKYKVVVYYVISKDGNLSDIKCGNDPGYGICEAALRIIKKSKSWTPATQQGSPVHNYRH